MCAKTFPTWEWGVTTSELLVAKWKQMKDNKELKPKRGKIRGIIWSNAPRPAALLPFSNEKLEGGMWTGDANKHWRRLRYIFFCNIDSFLTFVLHGSSNRLFYLFCQFLKHSLHRTWINVYFFAINDLFVRWTGNQYDRPRRITNLCIYMA